MTLDREDIEAIASAVAAKLAAKPAADPEIINRREAMTLLRCNSKSALDSTLADLKIKRVSAGKFRRKDIINAIARRTLA